MNQIFGQRFINIFVKWRFKSQLLPKLRAVEVATSLNIVLINLKTSTRKQQQTSLSEEESGKL